MHTCFSSYFNDCSFLVCPAVFSPQPSTLGCCRSFFPSPPLYSSSVISPGPIFEISFHMHMTSNPVSSTSNWNPDSCVYPALHVILPVGYPVGSSSRDPYGSLSYLSQVSYHVPCQQKLARYTHTTVNPTSALTIIYTLSILFLFFESSSRLQTPKRQFCLSC